MGDLSLILPDFEAPAEPLAKAIADDPAIAGFLRSARTHLGLEIGFIARWVEGDAREITHVDTELDLPIGTGFRQPREETYCWQVLHARLPQLIRDTAGHPLAQQLHITAALPVGCNVSVPLTLSDGTAWGSFCLIGRQPDLSMNERDLAIATSFAAMAAERIEELQTRQTRHEQTRARIEDMFAGDAVTIYQQPIHDLASGKPVGVECLARFPDVNKRGPGAWFEDAESAGLGEELEMTAVRGAFETLGGVPESFFASIKAPARSVLSGAVRGALADCEASNVVITLTRHGTVEELDELDTQMQAFRPGVKIAIDGVGADLASLRLVARVKPDLVKLDMQLSRGIAEDAASRAMVSAVVELTRTFAGKVVAEGIESAEEAAAFKGLGVDFAQGYLFARPLPMVAATQHLMGISA